MSRQKISELLKNENIDLFSVLSLEECRITRKYLLDRAGLGSGSVIIMAVPYVSRDFGIGNVSEYAKPRDYHLFFKEFFERVIPRLSQNFPEKRFVGFADHSPIDEKDAAARSGLGIIGQNSLLITKKYSSFIFLGEIITDMILESDITDIGYCENCGACKRACPLSLEPHLSCISAITQKKGELSDNEISAIKKANTIWGCDICQTACPHTKAAFKSGTIFTTIPFFTEKRIPSPTYRLIADMDDSDFSERAFSWRGRQTLLRNLELFEKED